MYAARSLIAPVAVWLLAALLLLPLAAGLQARLQVEAHVDGAEYAKVAKILETEFDSPFAGSLILVVRGSARSLSEGAPSTLDRIVTGIEGDPDVARTLSYRDGNDPFFLVADGTGALVVVGLRPNASPQAKERALERLRARTDALAADLRRSSPQFALRWTGEAALNADLRRVSGEDANAGEARVLPVVIIALVVAFASLLAATLPIGIGLLSVPLALGAAAVLSRWFPLSVVLVNVTTMLGLGLGIDYALLMVSRFREELATGSDPKAAACATQKGAGPTIMLSAATVAIGFCALLFVPIDEIQSIAAGGVIVLIISVLLATTLLPPVLAALGSKVNALSIRRKIHSRAKTAWGWWGAVIFAHPWRFLAAGAAPLVVLALQAPRLDINLPRGEWLPKSAPSVRAIGDLNAIGHGGFFQAINVVVTLPPGLHISDETGWNSVAHITDVLHNDPRIETVRSITTAIAVPRPWAALPAVPAAVVDGFANRERTTALIVAIPKANANSFELSQLVRELRNSNSTAGNTGSLMVGGIPALNTDYEDTVRTHFIPLALLVVGVTFVVLAFGYRSPVLALKAIVLNALSVAAACGALVLVFQDGIGAGWLGLDGPTGGVFPNIPILVFCIVFGLSMDYEVFLFNRVRERHRDGCNDRDAMTFGLDTTAGVISSAALIMIIVFAGFCWGEFLLIKMLGFTLASAILIDVTLVRLVVGPALFALAGKWNWWPARTTLTESTFVGN